MHALGDTARLGRWRLKPSCGKNDGDPPGRPASSGMPQAQVTIANKGLLDKGRDPAWGTRATPAAWRAPAPYTTNPTHCFRRLLVQALL